MTIVTAKNLTNSPFEFRSSSNAIVRFPAYGEATGDFTGSQLDLLEFWIAAGGFRQGANPEEPANTELPTIAGTAAFGQVLTASPGTWTGNPAPTFTYQWRRGSTDIAGATATTYTLVAADAGQTISVNVTATNSEGSASATSAATSAVTRPPSNTAVPTVTGTLTVGSVQTATNGTWVGSPTPTYARVWQRSANGTSGWTNIAGATATTYTLVEDDLDQYIRVVVTGTNSTGNASANSVSRGPVVAE